MNENLSAAEFDPQRRRNFSWVSLLLVILLLSASMYPVYRFRILNTVHSDFGNHNQYAVQMLRGERVPDHILAHPLYGILLGGMIWLTRSGLDADHASILLMTGCQVVSGILIYLWLGRRTGKYSEALRAGLSIGLVAAAPLMLLVPLDGKYYFGYIGLVNFHNPTITLLRPLALGITMLSMQAFTDRHFSSGKTILLAILTILATLTKPNFTLTWIPVILLEILILTLKREPPASSALISGLILPGIIVLIGQYLMTYTSSAGSSSGIIWAPLAVERTASDYLPVKLICSLFFPLIMLATYRKKLFSSREVQIAWLAFLFGIAQLYLLAESGNRFADGNFRWSAQITLFLLFVITVRFVWKQPAPKKSAIYALVLGFSPHILAGIVYWLHCLVSKGYG